jgi:hypothetical protein
MNVSMPTLSQQVEACELAAYRVRQKKPLAMRDSEREEHARRLEAAAKTLRQTIVEPRELSTWRDAKQG